MKKLGKTECPYCQRKVGLIGAWILKTQGEYRCPQCGGISDIVLTGRIYLLAVAAALVSAVLLLIHVFFVRVFSWTSLILVPLPFLLFFLVCPLYVRLRKPVIRRNGGTPGRRPNPGQHPEPGLYPEPGQRPLTEFPQEMDENLERTIVMDPIRRP